jgi:hypothetical protein
MMPGQTGGTTQSSKTTTSGNTTANSAPWAPTQPYLQGIMGDADALYKSGVGAKVNTMSSVVPFSQQTVSGMNDIEKIAGQYGGVMQKPLQGYSEIMDYMKPIAMGDFTNDPTFNQTLGAAQEAGRTAVNMSASNAGRSGSGVHQSTLARTIGEMTDRLKLGRQNMAIDAYGQYGTQLPGAFSAAMAPANAMMDVGSNYEQLQANEINDKFRIFNETQQKPWEQLAQYNAILSGAGQLGRSESGSAQTVSKTNTSAASQPIGWQNILGFGLSALGSR